MTYVYYKFIIITHKTVIGCNIISVFKNLWNSWYDKYDQTKCQPLRLDIGRGKFLYVWKYMYFVVGHSNNKQD